MTVVAVSVVLGVVLSSVSQAAESERPRGLVADLQSWGSSLMSSLNDLELAERLRNWRPRIEVDRGGDGVNLAHPFGAHGPGLKFSTKVPSRIRRSLAAGGDSQIGSLNDRPDGYIFLQKRW